jgi:hypothetical protein
VKTDDLIAELSGQLRPTPPRAGVMPLVIGVGAGAAASAVLMIAWLGIRPDLMPAMHTGAYWMKFGYTLVFAGLAFWAALRLSHPGTEARTAMRAIALPVAAMLALGVVELATSGESKSLLFYGHSHQVCPERIFVIALPVFAGALWGLRKLAPTHLALTGAVAGLLAGAAGAWVYAFHCDESGMLFVSVWYTLGIAAVGALGAVLGRFVLRW